MGRLGANLSRYSFARATLGAVVGLWLLAALPPPTTAAVGAGEWAMARDHLHVAPHIGPHGHSQTPPADASAWLAPARTHERTAGTDALNAARPAAILPATDSEAGWADASEQPPAHALDFNHPPRAPPPV